MAIDIMEIQAALREDDLDAWLLYDFHGSNPIARGVVGLNETSKLTTRRWYYLIPASGKPRALVHSIERENLAHLPGTRLEYSSHRQLEASFVALLAGCRRIAMEYSPNCLIPYISRVDAGTVNAVCGLGVDVVSSGDLVQRFEAVWSEQALDTHREASERLYRIKDRAFALVSERLSTTTNVSEFEIQQAMVAWFEDEGLVTDSPPVVAAQQSSGNPHYLPTETDSRPIHLNEIVLIDLWGKLDITGAVFADITWVGYTGSPVPSEYSGVFQVACEARDAAIELVAEATQTGRELRGWQVDRAARSIIDTAGYGPKFMHRTGHSLGEAVHGNGVHMDDYETHDDRRLLPGTGFTIEPGIYLDKFGVRTEVNMYVGHGKASVTGPAQEDLVSLA